MGLSISSSSSSVTDTYTVTGNGTTLSKTSSPIKSYAIQVVSTGTVVSWDVRLEGSLDGSNFTQILQHTNVTGNNVVLFSGSVLSPSMYFRSRCAGLTLGSGTNIVVTILGMS